MKRGHMHDDERRRDRSSDVKRQRRSDGHYQQQQRHPQSNDSYRHQQRSNDSYSRRDDSYLPPRRPGISDTSSSRDHGTRPDERATFTPYERRDSAYERDARANGGSSSYVTPAVAATDNNAAAAVNDSSAAPGVRLLSEAKESDPHRLAQRQKQIDYGKNTVGYDRYCAAVPRHQRRRHVHPMTPDRTLNVSKKAFDGMIRKWRQALHKYDPPELQDVSEEQRGASAAKAAMSVTTAPLSQPTASSTGATASSSACAHDADMADLDPERDTAAAPASTASSSAPTLSIFENFVEGDLDDDDDDDDDLL